jgi:HEAT repeat protein
MPHFEEISPATRGRVEESIREQRDLRESIAAHEREVRKKYERTIAPDTPEGWFAALSHPEWETRAAAIRRLGSLRSEAPVDLLLAALRDEDGPVAVAAAEALASLGGKAPMDGRVAEALFEQIAMTDDDPQSAAEEALRALAPWLPRDVLVAHLGDPELDVRETALTSLVALGQDAPVGILTAAAGDISQEIRDIALTALHQTFPAAFRELLQEAESVLMGRGTGPVLDSLVRYCLAEEIALRRIATPEAIEELVELLSWPHWRVRLAATETLAQLNITLPPTVIERLQALSIDPESSALRKTAAGLVAGSSER